jgi:N-acetylneuraminate synthase
MKIQIKPGLEIGDGCGPFIVAEVGSNWLTFEDCKDSITKAKLAGADAVKFQLFNLNALYGQHTDRHDRVSPYLDEAWLPKLKEKADACGVEFMCSAFSPDLIEAVDPYVNIHKVASSELTHFRMLEKLRRIGKPVVLSTGGSGTADIRQAIHVLRDKTYSAHPPCQVILLYCIAAYPTNEVYLDNIGLLRTTFGLPTGFSDHTTHVAPLPKLAVQHGACVLEKHFSAIDSDTPDRPHSLNPDQFKRMVSHIRGDVRGVLGPTAEERSMILRHNRRIIATRDIGVGDAFTEGFNFGIYRSLKDDTHAYSPWSVGDVNGRASKREIKAGNGIGPGDV